MSPSSDIIRLIYKAALTPDRWPELLESLADLIDQRRHFDKELSELDSLISPDTPNDVNQPDEAIAVDETERSVIPTSTLEYGHIEALDLLPHFSQALLIAEQINKAQEKQESLGLLLDRLPTGVILVDDKAQTQVTNKVGEEILRSCHGLSRKKDQTLVCCSRRETIKLHGLIKDLSTPKAMVDVGRSMSVITQDDVDPVVQVSLVPISQSLFCDEGIHGTVAVFISSRKFRPSLNAKTMEDIYDLTPTEAQVLCQLAQGLSINEISERLFVSPHTARTHVKRLLVKTGTHRQSELVGLVLTGPPALVSSRNDQSKSSFDDVSLFDFHRAITTPESMECERIRLHDGRFLAYMTYGDPEGTPIIFCHSTKGSRFQVPPPRYMRQLRDAGVYLVVPDRPGFGLSDPNPNRGFLDWAHDAIELADSLGFKRYIAGGYSIGGIFALANAYVYPDRVSRVVLVGCGIPPVDDESLQQMLPIHKMVFYLARHAPKVHHAFMKLMVRGVLTNPRRYLEKVTSTLCSGDLSTFDLPGYNECFMKCSYECGRQGGDATIYEQVLYLQRLGFDLSRVQSPCDLWHGKLDQNIPLALGRKLSETLPNARLHVVPNYGHMLYFRSLSEICRDAVNTERSEIKRTIKQSEI